MDERLQQLRRQAAAGDIQAALRYYFNTQGLPQPESTRPENYSINIVERRIRGQIVITPIKGNELYITNTDTRNAWGGFNAVPIIVNNVPAYIRCRYFFYDDLGWVPYPEETYNHAKFEQEKETQSNRSQGNYPVTPLEHFLPRVSQSFLGCTRCTKELDVTFLARREPGHIDDVLPRKGLDLVHQTLKIICEQFATQHPDALKAAHLHYLNDLVPREEKKLTEIERRLGEQQQLLGRLLIDKIRLEDEGF